MSDSGESEKETKPKAKGKAKAKKVTKHTMYDKISNPFTGTGADNGEYRGFGSYV